jgi:hypothetical protein
MTSRLELLRRYLDGQLDLETSRELEALLARDAGARRELDAYRDLLSRLQSCSRPEPAHDFAAQVMRRLPAAPRRSLLQDVLLRPRLSVAGMLGLAFLLLLTWMPLDRLRQQRVAPPPPARADATGVNAPVANGQAPAGITPSRVVVRFVLPAPGARRVALAGDFNGWRIGEILLSDEKGDGIFSATVPLPPGHHSYLFWVDGRWVQDPAAPASVPDGFGQRNSVLDL